MTGEGILSLFSLNVLLGRANRVDLLPNAITKTGSTDLSTSSIYKLATRRIRSESFPGSRLFETAHSGEHQIFISYYHQLNLYTYLLYIMPAIAKGKQAILAKNDDDGEC